MKDQAHILVPVDLSEKSLYAVRAVKSLAFRFSRITLLHVYNPLPSTPSISFDRAPAQKLIFTDLERRLTKSLMEIRRNELKNIENVSVELECTALLSAAGAICQFAESVSVDLIALATARRTGVPYFLMGNVAQEVVRCSPCPVLVVHAGSPRTQQPIQPVLVDCI